jgi:HEAT repeat protein
VERYGPENIPILMNMLMDTREEAATRMAAANLLAAIGDERIVDPILQIIQEGGLTTYGLPSFVFSLGKFASRRRDPKALQFLLDHTREADWRALSPLFAGFPSNVLEIYARADRIALSRTGDLRADEIFRRLLSEAIDGNRAEEARELRSCLSDSEQARIKEAERLFDVE